MWQRFFDEWRLEVDDRDSARSYRGRRAADVLDQVRGPWRPEDVPGALAALHAHTDAEAGNVEVVPGAVELVEELHRRGRLVAVVTSASRTWTRRVLDDVLGIGAKIPVVVTAEEVETGKPHPEGYLRACRRLGVDPATCAAVEDSEAGVQALAAAGIGTVVGVTTTAPAAQLRAAGAEATVADLRAPASLLALGFCGPS